MRSKETLLIIYLKYPVLDMIQRIHLWIIWINNPFLEFSKKKRNICFRIKNLDLDFSK